MKTNKSYNWENKIILIAEDMETSNYYFEAALRKTGIQILWATSGKEALEIVKNNENIDLILMDINMPEMNGIDATRHIRKLNKSIPIIIQTAYVLSGEEVESKKAGATDFLSKPIKFQHLLYTINNYLKTTIPDS